MKVFTYQFICSVYLYMYFNDISTAFSMSGVVGRGEERGEERRINVVI